MHVDFERTVSLDAPVDRVWQFLSDVERVAACVPNLSELEPTPEGGYTARANDRLGPFRVDIPVKLVVVMDRPAQTMRAQLTGTDRLSQTRVSAVLSARCEARAGGGTTAIVAATGEVLGPVASLGAGPIRRRLDDIFEAFVESVSAQVASGDNRP